MKKLALLAIFGLLFSLTAQVALAGGGQNLGEKGLGEAVQNQVNDDCGSFWFCS